MKIHSIGEWTAIADKRPPTGAPLVCVDSEGCLWLCEYEGDGFSLLEQTEPQDAPFVAWVLVPPTNGVKGVSQ